MLKGMYEPCLSIETLSAPTLGADAPPRPCESQQVVAVHGFATTPEVTWLTTGWVRQLHRAGADVHLVTLPCHRLTIAQHEDAVEVEERGHTRQLAVTWHSTGLISSLTDTLAQVLAPQATPVHLLGYSLGARICWQTALEHPQLVQSLTLGGMPLAGHLAEVQTALAQGNTSGQALPAGLQAVLVASPLPRAHLASFTAQPVEPFSAQDLPACPTFLFAGAQDDLTTDLPALAATLPHPASAYLELAGRDHISSLTSGQARRAATDFIARHAVSPAGREPRHTVA
ncbi:MAG: alpha/beta fold hydrolase [Rothia sp. (in: high G+C Gram-positive bacteria)]|uniref:alpha/beta fold hydrolase n=1 Tax=Rothia sp. (in: high G+C Gram-positive bacteria) TaxID=1885016 RepID=UPI0027028F51|nr:alpha/beta fold hydrolase [Rothia sp. (in: high G+C Gram-positive bacteria)]